MASSPARSSAPRDLSRRRPPAADRSAAINVLFLCTGNSARSVLAEALLNHLGGGRFRAFSAGSHPKGEVHPLALRELRAHGLQTGGLRSKSWDEFGRPDAPRMDTIITVCDNAARETCPVWPGHPATAHWSIDDPAAVEGPEEARVQAFTRAFSEIEGRVRALIDSMQSKDVSR